MAQSPTRRLSTGGKPPICTRETYVVEEAPSHDDTPCFAAWARDELVRVPAGWSASDFSINDTRPGWSVQFYDTTPESNNPEHLKALAEALHRETREERELYSREGPDRFDVWGMPLPPSMSDEERVAKCKAHAVAEIASRDAVESGEWAIQPHEIQEQWRRAIVITDRPRDLWDEEDEGGFLVVFWDLKPGCLETKSYPVPETRFFRETLADLGSTLGQDLRFGITSFYSI